MIKIDCDGMDFEVLRGALETIKKHKPAVFIEIWREGLMKRGYGFDDINRFMRDLGYSGTRINGIYKDMSFDMIYD